MVNVNNLYNTFIILIDKCKTDKEVDEICKTMKIHIGSKFWVGFQEYILKKLGSDHKIFHIDANSP